MIENKTSLALTISQVCL